METVADGHLVSKKCRRDRCDVRAAESGSDEVGRRWEAPFGRTGRLGCTSTQMAPAAKRRAMGTRGTSFSDGTRIAFLDWKGKLNEGDGDREGNGRGPSRGLA
jgi:hypothetical protein